MVTIINKLGCQFCFELLKHIPFKNIISLYFERVIDCNQSLLAIWCLGGNIIFEFKSLKNILQILYSTSFFFLFSLNISLSSHMVKDFFYFAEMIGGSPFRSNWEIHCRPLYIFLFFLVLQERMNKEICTFGSFVSFYFLVLITNVMLSNAAAGFTHDLFLKSKFKHIIGFPALNLDTRVCLLNNNCSRKWGLDIFIHTLKMKALFTNVLPRALTSYSLEHCTNLRRYLSKPFHNSNIPNWRWYHINKPTDFLDLTMSFKSWHSQFAWRHHLCPLFFLAIVKEWLKAFWLKENTMENSYTCLIII